jgi:hypothetical protein
VEPRHQRADQLSGAQYPSCARCSADAQPVAQVRFWHQYHFGEAPKEFRYSTRREDLVFSQACSYQYTWLADKNRFKRSQAAPT